MTCQPLHPLRSSVEFAPRILTDIEIRPLRQNHANQTPVFDYARMIERSVTPSTEHSLAEQAAVAIIGRHQV
jgi:hypothetical protein